MRRKAADQFHLFLLTTVTNDSVTPEAKIKVTNRSGIEKIFQTVVGSLLSREGIKGRRGTDNTKNGVKSG